MEGGCQIKTSDLSRLGLRVKLEVHLQVLYSKQVLKTTFFRYCLLSNILNLGELFLRDEKERKGEKEEKEIKLNNWTNTS